MRKAVEPCFRLFARNTKGNVAVLFGLALIPIMIAIGGAVDYGRALLVRERMADAADAAALAIGSWAGLTDAELKAKAQNTSMPTIRLPSLDCRRHRGQVRRGRHSGHSVGLGAHDIHGTRQRPDHRCRS